MAAVVDGVPTRPPLELQTLCVFCGASMGTNPAYQRAARAMGEAMSQQGIKLCYGGGTVGLMGEVAKGVAEGLGSDAVTGIIPEALAPREVSGPTIGKMIIVQDMHSRKALMAEHSDGFIAMPGGFGTLEELLEVVTWQQLGFHRKPVALLNILGFYDPLLAFFKHSVDEGFIKPMYNNLIVSSDPHELIAKMRAFTPPQGLVEAALASKLSAIGVDISLSSAQADAADVAAPHG